MMGIFDELEDLKVVCEAIGKEQEKETPEVPDFDLSKCSAYIKAPSDIDGQTMSDIAGVIDGKYDVEPPEDNTVPVATPSTTSRLLNSITIVYITNDKGMPIAAANIVDPTVEDYRGIVPIKFYTLLSGYNLNGRAQLEFFAVSDEYRSLGVGQELRAQLDTLDTATFCVTDVTDEDSTEVLAQNGFQFIGKLEDKTQPPVYLWVDNAGKQVEKGGPDEDDDGADVLS